jgi:hypothetical protein
MKEEFVPYETALKLKELGFDKPCLGYYNTDPFLPMPTFNLNQPFDHVWCLPAPLYQQAFEFFWLKYDLLYKIEWNKFYPKSPYEWCVRPIWRDEPVIPYGTGGLCINHRDAQNLCLKAMIIMASKPDDTLLDAFQEEAFD